MTLMDSVHRYRQDREFEIAEKSESQRERLLEVQGLQAASVSRTAAAAEDAASAVEGLGVEISRMAAVADWAMPSIVEHLALTAERLGGIEQMLANPTETAAAEFYRRGSFALSSGWLEEAETDLLAAVSIYPYNPRTWFNLGVTRQRAGLGQQAADAFGRCARYGLSVAPGLTARAVILSAFNHRAAGDSDGSEQILREYADKLDRCAELHLALGVHHADHDHLVKALVLAPELAADAHAAKAPGLEAAANVVRLMAEGPVQRLRAIERIAADLVDATRHFGMPPEALSVPGTVNFPNGSGEAVFIANGALASAADVVATIAAQIQYEYVRQCSTADSASRDQAKATAEAEFAAGEARIVENWAGVLSEEVVPTSGSSAQAVLAAEQVEQNAARALNEANRNVRQAHQQAQSAQQAAELALTKAHELTEYASERQRRFSSAQEAEQMLRARRAVAEAYRLVDNALESERKATSDAEERLNDFHRSTDPFGLKGRKLAAWEATRAQLEQALEDTRQTSSPGFKAAWEAGRRAEMAAGLDFGDGPRPAFHGPSDDDLNSAALEAEEARQAVEQSTPLLDQGVRAAQQTQARVADARQTVEEFEQQAAEAEAMLAQATDDRRRAAHPDQVWRDALGFVVGLSTGRESGLVLEEIRGRFEVDQRQTVDRLDALQHDLLVLFVEPSRRRAPEALDRSLAATRTVEDAQLRISQVAAVLSTAQDCVEAARQIAAPQPRIIPFDVPDDQWSIDT